MEELLRNEFPNSVVQYAGGKCSRPIPSTFSFMLDNKKVFVKGNTCSGSREMFDGELESLKVIKKTDTVNVPKPLKVFEKGDAAFIAMEFLKLNSLNRNAADLGWQLAEMHLFNSKQKSKAEKSKNLVGEKIEHVDKFGFAQTTYCGVIAMENQWTDTWQEFFTRHRLKNQLNLVEENYHDRDARMLWPEVERNLDKLFPRDLEIIPALLHGDLWAGNVGELNGKPFVFDPGCFYGHSEYDLAISHMFGGFSSDFFKAYHEKIPQQSGFGNRLKAYKLFHYLNHWNHFGSQYKSSSISLMKQLAKI